MGTDAPARAGLLGDDLTPVTVGGLRGGYAAAGDGPPAVLLASPLALARTYRPTVAALAARFRVYAVQMPGCGRCDGVPAGWGPDDYARWAAGFLAALDLAGVTLIGHSYAGAVPVIVAARHPGRVARVVATDAVGAGGPHSPLRVLAAAAIDVARESGLVAQAWHHVAGNLVRHPRNFVRLLWDCLSLDATADAARVAVPALVAWGTRDATLPPRCGAAYARGLPRATTYHSTGGHDWLITRPGEFAAAVGRFAGAGPGMMPASPPRAAR